MYVDEPLHIGWYCEPETAFSSVVNDASVLQGIAFVIVAITAPAKSPYPQSFYLPKTIQRIEGASGNSVLNWVLLFVVADKTLDTTLALLSVGATIPVPIANQVAVKFKE